ncbi:MAG: 4-(cytidine 5'-diphospho)-2-C-methyl-D-erythritol kinase [Janthinobacterium lividum]
MTAELPAAAELPTELIESAPAKLNLALHVRRRRDDGYHDLETVFAFTAFGDTVRARPAGAVTLAAGGPFAAAVGPGDNLVVRAATALAAAAGVTAGAAIHLDKHIPVAAGMGGGSADAAATLRLLNRLWRLDWPLARLEPLAAALGADVPACLYDHLLYGSGRGEALAPLPERLTGTPVLLVNPRVAVPTGPVFAGWDRVDRGALVTAGWRTQRNDLTSPARRIAPVIGEVLAALAAGEAELTRMSGSGATCFALYADAAARDRAATALAARQPGWWVMPTILL